MANKRASVDSEVYLVKEIADCCRPLISSTCRDYIIIYSGISSFKCHLPRRDYIVAGLSRFAKEYTQTDTTKTDKLTLTQVFQGVRPPPQLSVVPVNKAR